MIENILFLKTLKAGEAIYEKGSVIYPPFPSDINIKEEVRRGLIRFYKPGKGQDVKVEAEKDVAKTKKKKDNSR